MADSKNTDVHEISATSLASGLLILVLVAGYTAGVLGGWLKNRIDAVTLGVIAGGILIATGFIRPDIFKRITHIGLGSVVLDLQESQKQQENQLEFILSILIPEELQKHLLKLNARDTRDYKGGSQVIDELRRLAQIGLVRRRGGHTIGAIPTDGKTCDIAEYVELTEPGERLARKLIDMEAEKQAQKAAQAGG